MRLASTIFLHLLDARRTARPWCSSHSNSPFLTGFHLLASKFRHKLSTCTDPFSIALPSPSEQPRPLLLSLAYLCLAIPQTPRYRPNQLNPRNLSPSVPHALMEDDEYTTSKMGDIKLEEGANGAHVKKERSASIPTPNDSNDGSRSPAISLNGVKSRSDSADTPSSARPSRPTRKASQKKIAREPLLFSHLPDVTPESRKAFQLIPDCLYGSKHLGSTDNDALDCDCNQEWRKFTFTSNTFRFVCLSLVADC